MVQNLIRFLSQILSPFVLQDISSTSLGCDKYSME